MAWNYRGSKLDFIHAISNTTGIPCKVLLRHEPLAGCSVARRMSWTAHRQITRIEDIGYCILGIFDVNMPLIYGKGLKAFCRLQEEIINRNNNLTVFAWDVFQIHEQQTLVLFASLPAAFVTSSSVAPFSEEFSNFSVTNKGLLVSGDAPLRAAVVTGEEGEILQYLLILERNAFTPIADGGIYLCKVGPRLFYRDGRLPLAGFGEKCSDKFVCSMLLITIFLSTQSPPTPLLFPPSEIVQSMSLSTIYLGLKTQFLRLCGTLQIVYF
jgi:hypothetical protein